MENLTEIERQKFERARKRVKSIAGFYKHLMAYILVNLFLISMKYFKLDPGENFFEFSTFSTAFFWGIGLAFHAAGVFGTNVFLGNDWEEKKIDELMKKNQGNKWE
ncbi:2TM domain-containing protein [Flavobacterium soli]|uniref:2TM domain-containing protein n=1 Tax=Flavobacterium soli TaxID=344881 RepID=UPI0004058E9D|nr:2TM domain-containing protein [Flavobacterium soli]